MIPEDESLRAKQLPLLGTGRRSENTLSFEACDL